MSISKYLGTLLFVVLSGVTALGCAGVESEGEEESGEAALAVKEADTTPVAVKEADTTPVEEADTTPVDEQSAQANNEGAAARTPSGPRRPGLDHGDGDAVTAPPHIGPRGGDDDTCGTRPPRVGPWQRDRAITR